MPVAEVFLKAIISQLDQYIRSVSFTTSTEIPVVLGNIATSKLAGGSNEALEEKIVVSLVNIEEESSLKNKTTTSQQGQPVLNFLPPVFLNLHLLFAANFSEYDTAFIFLIRVVEFFQSNKVFTLKNLPFANTNGTDVALLNHVEIVFDLYTLNFEQLNNLWGSLGGKQMPFVLYRARLIPVFMEQPLERSGLITEINLDTLDLITNQ